MLTTKVDSICGCLCLLLFWLISATAAAQSIFDGYIPCAKEDQCENQRGGFYEDQPGALDGSRVTGYGSADARPESDLGQSLVPTDSVSHLGLNFGDSGASVLCNTGGQPTLVAMCSANALRGNDR